MSKDIPPSIEAYKKYGVHTSDLKKFVTLLFKFPDSHRDCLSKYYLLYWSPSYAYEQMQKGVILREGLLYNVLYLGTDYANIKYYYQIKLSFRMPQIEYIRAGVLPTVLIAPIMDKKYKGEENNG